MPTLTVLRDGKESRVLHWERGSVGIGRHESNDVFLREPTVSRWHAALYEQESGWRLRDLGSRTGTFLSGRRCVAYDLADGDAFEVGPYRIVFEGETGPRRTPADFLGLSAVARTLLRDVDKCAAVERDVLLLGESGTGKELLARRIHKASPRRNGPLVVVDVNTIPAELFESELFGHREGAFTGATSDREGKVAAAAGGTLFLDEIGDLAAPQQGKLLRLLQEREYSRVGEDRARAADVRIIAATHRDLEALRLDLRMRLSQGVMVKAPPLRERAEDIPFLAYHFLDQLSSGLQRGVESFAPEVIEAFWGHDWPGNVRQLRAAVSNALVFAEEQVKLRDFRYAGEVFGIREDALPSLQEVEREHIIRVLHATSGNQRRAAAILGINPNTLKEKMVRHGLERGEFRTRKGP